MYIVYVLQDNNGKLYKGFTNNLARRFSEHKNKHVKSTKNLSGITIVYTEKFETLSEARKHEVFLKSAAGRRFLKEKLRS